MCLKTDGHVLANSWIGYFFCYITIMGIYYSNTWNVSLAVFRLQKNPMVTCYVSQSLAFPMLSSSIFSANGSVYHQSAVFGTTFTLNQTALQEVGLPALTGKQILKFICDEF